jgi:hypothetical protein
LGFHSPILVGPEIEPGIVLLEEVITVDRLNQPPVQDVASPGEVDMPRLVMNAIVELR